MPHQAPIQRPPHFTYDDVISSSSHSRWRADVGSVYNEVTIADRVVRACSWTDNSADFVFSDGTVLSFCDEMQTFVAFPPAAITALKTPSNNNNIGDDNQGDYFYTPFTLSKYENKVREALHIYNYYSPRPRVIAGLMAAPCEVWRQSSPIDSLVIAADRRLFERHGSHATLWCAMRRVSLTLHGGRVTFSVRWPAPAVERNMAHSIFVRPVDNHGVVSGTLERVRACHYAWVEQTFPVLEPPEEWVEMLETAMRLDAEVFPKCGQDGEENSHNNNSNNDNDNDRNCQMIYRTTPCTARSRQPCRFSKMRREDVHSLIATSQMQNATCHRLIRDPTERVVWRYDADPTGRVPHAVYWGLYTRNVSPGATHASGSAGNFHGNNNNNNNNKSSSSMGIHSTVGSVLAMVREDESTVLAEPHGQSYVIHHWRRDGTYHQYHQSPDGELGLPPVIPQRHARSRKSENTANSNSDNSNDNSDEISSSPVMAGEAPDGTIASRICASPLYFSGVLEEAPFSALHRGRYLPDVGASCIQLSQFNLASLRAEQQQTLHNISLMSPGAQVACDFTFPSGASASASSANKDATHAAQSVIDRTRMRFLSSDPALAAAAAEGNVVFLTTSIDGVGTFTALTNGTIRCHFEDRTILFLVPGADDNEENLVGTCLFRDATQCSMRLVKCAPHHPMFRYVSHALQFRRFARLSPDARASVADETAALRLQLLGDCDWDRERGMEWELQQLLGRTEALLSGNEELGRVNHSLLHDDKDTPSAYFS